MAALEQNQVIKTKLFHSILVSLCALIITPLFLFASFVLLQNLLNGQDVSVIGLVFIIFSTLSLLVWGGNAIRFVILKPEIVISTEGVYFDISRTSRSWGVIPWDNIVGFSRVRYNRAVSHLIIYPSQNSPLYKKARWGRFFGKRFLRVNIRYMDNKKDIAVLLNEKMRLQHSAKPSAQLHGKIED